NSSENRLDAVLSGIGLAYLPEDMVQSQIQTGELIEVLTDWCQPFDGYYLYYPNRQLSSPAFKLIAEALRFHP
ncbi:LysR substrate-binding domain-containing protein, partial [Psychrobacter sp. 4Bb]